MSDDPYDYLYDDDDFDDYGEYDDIGPDYAFDEGEIPPMKKHTGPVEYAGDIETYRLPTRDIKGTPLTWQTRQGPKSGVYILPPGAKQPTTDPVESFLWYGSRQPRKSAAARSLMSGQVDPQLIRGASAAQDPETTFGFYNRSPVSEVLDNLPVSGFLPGLGKSFQEEESKYLSETDPLADNLAKASYERDQHITESAALMFPAAKAFKAGKTAMGIFWGFGTLADEPVTGMAQSVIKTAYGLYGLAEGVAEFGAVGSTQRLEGVADPAWDWMADKSEAMWQGLMSADPMQIADAGVNIAALVFAVRGGKVLYGATPTPGLVAGATSMGRLRHAFGASVQKTRGVIAAAPGAMFATRGGLVKLGGLATAKAFTDPTTFDPTSYEPGEWWSNFLTNTKKEVLHFPLTAWAMKDAAFAASNFIFGPEALDHKAGGTMDVAWDIGGHIGGRLFLMAREFPEFAEPGLFKAMIDLSIASQLSVGFVRVFTRGAKTRMDELTFAGKDAHARLTEELKGVIESGELLEPTYKAEVVESLTKQILEIEENIHPLITTLSQDAHTQSVVKDARKLEEAVRAEEPIVQAERLEQLLKSERMKELAGDIQVAQDRRARIGQGQEILKEQQARFNTNLKAARILQKKLLQLEDRIIAEAELTAAKDYLRQYYGHVRELAKIDREQAAIARRKAIAKNKSAAEEIKLIDPGVAAVPETIRYTAEDMAGQARPLGHYSRHYATAANLRSEAKGMHDAGKAFRSHIFEVLDPIKRDIRGYLALNTALLKQAKKGLRDRINQIEIPEWIAKGLGEEFYEGWAKSPKTSAKRLVGAIRKVEGIKLDKLTAGAETVLVKEGPGSFRYMPETPRKGFERWAEANLESTLEAISSVEGFPSSVHAYDWLREKVTGLGDAVEARLSRARKDAEVLTKQSMEDLIQIKDMTAERKALETKWKNKAKELPEKINKHETNKAKAKGLWESIEERWKVEVNPKLPIEGQNAARAMLAAEETVAFLNQFSFYLQPVVGQLALIKDIIALNLAKGAPEGVSIWSSHWRKKARYFFHDVDKRVPSIALSLRREQHTAATRFTQELATTLRAIHKDGGYSDLNSFRRMAEFEDAEFTAAFRRNPHDVYNEQEWSLRRQLARKDVDRIEAARIEGTHELRQEALGKIDSDISASARAMRELQDSASALGRLYDQVNRLYSEAHGIVGGTGRMRSEGLARGGQYFSARPGAMVPRGGDKYARAPGAIEPAGWVYGDKPMPAVPVTGVAPRRLDSVVEYFNDVLEGKLTRPSKDISPAHLHMHNQLLSMRRNLDDISNEVLKALFGKVNRDAILTELIGNTAGTRLVSRAEAASIGLTNNVKRLQNSRKKHGMLASEFDDEALRVAREKHDTFAQKHSPTPVRTRDAGKPTEIKYRATYTLKEEYAGTMSLAEREKLMMLANNNYRFFDQLRHITRMAIEDDRFFDFTKIHDVWYPASVELWIPQGEAAIASRLQKAKDFIADVKEVGAIDASKKWWRGDTLAETAENVDYVLRSAQYSNTGNAFKQSQIRKYPYEQQIDPTKRPGKAKGDVYVRTQDLEKDIGAITEAFDDLMKLRMYDEFMGHRGIITPLEMPVRYGKKEIVSRRDAKGELFAIDVSLPGKGKKGRTSYLKYDEGAEASNKQLAMDKAKSGWARVVKQDAHETYAAFASRAEKEILESLGPDGGRIELINGIYWARRKGTEALGLTETFNNGYIVGMQNKSVKGTNTHEFGALNGMLNPDITYEMVYSQKWANAYVSKAGKAVRYFKAAHTIYSVMTHATNFLANALVLSPTADIAVWNPMNWPHFTKAATDFFSANKSATYYEWVRAGGKGIQGAINRAEFYSPAQQAMGELYLGVFGPVTKAKDVLLSTEAAQKAMGKYKLKSGPRPKGEEISRLDHIADKMADIALSSMQGRMPNASLAKLGKELLWDMPGVIYQAGDDFWRYSLYLKRRSQALSKTPSAGSVVNLESARPKLDRKEYGVHPSWTEADMRRVAIEGQKAFADYANMNGLFQWSRTSIWGKPFISFDARMVPKFLNWLHDHPFRGKFYMTAVDKMRNYNAELSGIDPDRVDHVMSLLPWYEKESMTPMFSMFPGMDKDITFVDTAKYMMGTRLLKGEDELATEWVGRMIASEHPIFETVLNGMGIDKFFKRATYPPLKHGGSDKYAISRIAERILQTWSPPHTLIGPYIAPDWGGFGYGEKRVRDAERGAARYGRDYAEDPRFAKLATRWGIRMTRWSEAELLDLADNIPQRLRGNLWRALNEVKEDHFHRRMTDHEYGERVGDIVRLIVEFDNIKAPKIDSAVSALLNRERKRNMQ